jgi:CRP/FNR family transcriptional regulator, cyclic AMP receptor protein
MIMTTESTGLRELPLFSGVPENDLAQMTDLVQRTTVPAGTLLISARLPGEAVYFILEGSVKVQVTSQDGNEHTIALLGPGDTLGEPSGGSRFSPAASVLTRQETTLLWMDGKVFAKCLDQSPVLSRNLTRDLGERLRSANERIQALATLDVTGRVSRQILELAERYGTPVPGEGIRIPVPVTQGEIADMAAATRERVNQIMVRLRRAGVFSVDSNHCITIHQPDVLADLSRV